jgi:hypothetical protein
MRDHEGPLDRLTSTVQKGSQREHPRLLASMPEVCRLRWTSVLVQCLHNLGYVPSCSGFSFLRKCTSRVTLPVA